MLKVEAFPFTRHGTVDAVVVRVARDALPEPDAEEIEKDGLRSVQSLTKLGAPRTLNLVFPVPLKALPTTIDVDGVDVPRGAGMAATAEIGTATRRILEYVFSPLVELTTEALKERSAGLSRSKSAAGSTLIPTTNELFLAHPVCLKTQ